MEKLLRRLLPFKVIKVADHPDEEYLVRWFILGSKGEGDERRSLRLHKIKLSDNRYFHDHPWKFVSVILWGSYMEHTPYGSRKFRPGMLNRKTATALHRLELDRPVWTLFFCGRRQRTWGFVTEKGWVPWYEYEDKLPSERHY